MFAQRTNWNLTPNRLSQALAAHRAAGKPLLDLTISNPTECGFTYDGPGILEALSNPAALSYEPNAKGLESLAGPSPPITLRAKTTSRPRIFFSPPAPVK